MREERAVIGAKGLITLPKEWRDSHSLQSNGEWNVKVIYKLGGALIVVPANKELSRVEESMMTFLEKGLSVDELKAQVSILTETGQAISEVLEKMEKPLEA